MSAASSRTEPTCLSYLSMLLGDFRKRGFSLTKAKDRRSRDTAARQSQRETTQVSSLIQQIDTSLKRELSIRDPKWWWQENLPANRALSIVVVGNGPVDLLGEVIDAADVVVRINRALVEGFSEYVGTRTNVRFAVPQGLLDIDTRMLEEIPHLIYNPSGLEILSAVAGTEHRFSHHSHINRVNVQELSDPSYHRGLRRAMRCRGMTDPSTGAAAIQWALDVAGERHKVSICGFQTSKTVSGPLWAHYWDRDARLETLADNDRRTTGSTPRRRNRICEWLRMRATVTSVHNHDMERERKWLRSLASSGRIQILARPSTM